MASFDIQKKWFTEQHPINAGKSSAVLTFGGVVSDGDTVTIGGNKYEYDNNDTITDGNIAIDMIPFLPKASGVLTFTDIALASEVVVIGTETYEFVAKAEDVVEGNIPVVLDESNSISKSILALADAINFNSEIVTATATLDDDILNIYALNGGTAGNTIATTTTCTNALFSKTVLEGGLNTLSASDACIALEIAIMKNDMNVIGIANDGESEGAITVIAKKFGTESNSIIVSTTATNGSWGDGVTTLSGGSYGTVCPVPNVIVLDEKTNDLYVNIAPNSKSDANWRKLILLDY